MAVEGVKWEDAGDTINKNALKIAITDRALIVTGSTPNITVQ